MSATSSNPAGVGELDARGLEAAMRAGVDAGMHTSKRLRGINHSFSDDYGAMAVSQDASKAAIRAYLEALSRTGTAVSEPRYIVVDHTGCEHVFEDRDHAHAVANELTPSGAPNDSWVLVPRKPTEAMKQAVRDTGGVEALAWANAAWPTMLAASPDYHPHPPERVSEVIVEPFTDTVVILLTGEGDALSAILDNSYAAELRDKLSAALAQQATP